MAFRPVLSASRGFEREDCRIANVDSACDGFVDHGQWHLKGIVPEQGSFCELGCGSGDCRICGPSTMDGGRWSSDWQLRA